MEADLLCGDGAAGGEALGGALGGAGGGGLPVCDSTAA